MATRDEAVRLRLIDAGFSTGMAKQAAAAALLKRELDDLDGTHVDMSKSTQRTTRSTKEYTLEMAVAEERSRRFKAELRGQAKAAIDAERGIRPLGDEVDTLGDRTRNASRDIDRFSGRLGYLRDAAAVLGPSLVPIGAVAVPAVTGLANQLGGAAVGAASLIVAFQGVGDAVGAVNDAALEPTAANIEKARAAMQAIGPDAREFVQRFQELRPVLGDIRDAAAAGWFPGLTESLDNLEAVAPNIERIFEAVGEVGGELAADGSAWLGGEQGQQFLRFIEIEAPRALSTLGMTVGNFAAGLAEMWQAFQPMNNDFSDWLLRVSRDFNQWSQDLSQSEGFREFVAYIRESGPQVAETFAALGDAVVQVIQAVAPLGGPSLKIIETFAEAVAMIADSDMGTPIFAAAGALAIYNRSLAVTVGLQRQASAAGFAGGAGGGRVGRGFGAAARSAPIVAEAYIGGELATAALSENAPSAGDSKFGQAADAFLEGGGATQGLFGIIRGGKSAYDELTAATGKAGEAVDTYSASARAASRNVAQAAAKEREHASALRATTDAALGAFSAQTQWRQALKEARRQASKNNAGIRGMSKAAIDNRVRLEAMAAAQKEVARSGEATDAQMKRMRRSFIAAAEGMGVSRARARELAGELLDLDKADANPNINLVGAGAALSTVASLSAQVSALNGKTATAYVNVVRRGQMSGVNPLDPYGGMASGGTILGQRAPYGDKVLTMLAPGEEVISNRHGQADRNRDLLKAINANRMADGGTVARVPARRSSPSPQAVTHNVNVTVTGEMDLNRAKAQIHGIAEGVSRGVSRQEIDADQAWRQEQGYA